MNQLVIALLSVLALGAVAWASPSEDDIKTCTDHGQSRETCLHAVMP